MEKAGMAKKKNSFKKARTEESVGKDGTSDKLRGNGGVMPNPSAVNQNLTQNKETNTNNRSENTDQGTTHAGRSWQELKFEKNDRAPFIVQLQRIEDGDAVTKPLLPLEVSRLVAKAGIKFANIEPLTRKTWNIAFDSRDEANKALSNQYLKSLKMKIFLPSYHVLRKGVIRGIPQDMSIEEVIEGIKQENPRLKTVHADLGFESG